MRLWHDDAPTPTPWDQVHPPGPGTPPGQVHPRDQVHPPNQVHQPPQTRYTLRDQVHPPGPGTPPGTRYTPWTSTLTPPSSACWEIRATSGRYASYWNVFLLEQIFIDIYKLPDSAATAAANASTIIFITTNATILYFHKYITVFVDHTK